MDIQKGKESSVINDTSFDLEKETLVEDGEVVDDVTNEIESAITVNSKASIVHHGGQSLSSDSPSDDGSSHTSDYDSEADEKEEEGEEKPTAQAGPLPSYASMLTTDIDALLQDSEQTWIQQRMSRDKKHTNVNTIEHRSPPLSSSHASVHKRSRAADRSSSKKARHEHSSRSDKPDIAKAVQRLSKNSKPTPQRTVCKFYMEGHCVNGDDCPFLHEGLLKKREICKFHLLSCCIKGPQCPYSHDLKQYPCKFMHLFGSCKDKDDCRFSHSTTVDPKLLEELKQRQAAEAAAKKEKKENTLLARRAEMDDQHRNEFSGKDNYSTVHGNIPFATPIDHQTTDEIVTLVRTLAQHASQGSIEAQRSLDSLYPRLPAEAIRLLNHLDAPYSHSHPPPHHQYPAGDAYTYSNAPLDSSYQPYPQQEYRQHQHQYPPANEYRFYPPHYTYEHHRR